MVLAPQAMELDTRVIDDAALLDGAASVWAVITFAADLPTTPQQKRALAEGRTRFLERAESLGLTEADIEEYIRNRIRCDREPGRGRRPLLD